jgi:TonB-dependent starch-binding outer membrane protein SusC
MRLYNPINYTSFIINQFLTRTKWDITYLKYFNIWRKSIISAFSIIFIICTTSYGQEIDSIPITRFNQGHIYNLPLAIQGQIPGLLISRPGANPNASFAMLYRGFHSYQQRMEPLLLLHGVPIGWDFIDPFFIDSINVFSGTSLSQWGLQAGSGVMEAQGIRNLNQGLHIKFQQGITLERYQRAFPTMTAQQLRDEGLPASYQIGTDDINWLDEMTQSAFSNHTGIKIDFNKNRLSSNAGLSHRIVNGIQKNTGFNQLALNGGLSYEMWKGKIKIGTNAYLLNRSGEFGFTQFFEAAIAMNPTFSIDENVNYFNYFGGNPYLRLQNDMNGVNTNLLLWEGHMEASPLENWKIKLKYGQTNMNRSQEQNFGSAQILNTFLLEKNIERTDSRNILNLSTEYHLQKGIVDIIPYLRYSYQQIEYNQFGSRIVRTQPGEFQDQELRPEFGKYTVMTAGGGFDLEWKNSHLGFSFQKEGTNHLGANVGFGDFWGLDIKQRFSEKLSAFFSYAQTGMIPDKTGLSRAVFDVDPVFAFRHYANPNLKWEDSYHLEFGFQSIHFQNKLRSEIKGFYSQSSDLIALLMDNQVSIPGGFSNQNFGGMKNQGVEWILHMMPLKKGQVRYLTNINLNLMWSRWNDLEGDFQSLEGRNVGVNRGIGSDLYFQYNTLQKDRNIGAVKAINYLDIDSRTGNWVLDFNSQVDYFDNFAHQGQSVPRWWLGWSNQILWRKWRFDAFFRGVFGHVNANDTDFRYGTAYFPSNNIMLETYPERRDAGLRTFNTFSSYFIQNSSFLSLQYATVSRDISFKVGKKIYQSQLALISNNLFILTKMKSGDPEARLSSVPFWQRDEPLEARHFYYSGGIADAGTWLPARSFTLQFSMNF